MLAEIWAEEEKVVEAKEKWGKYRSMYVRVRVRGVERQKEQSKVDNEGS